MLCHEMLWVGNSYNYKYSYNKYHDDQFLEYIPQ